MKVSATNVKNSFGKYLAICDKDEILITKNDKIVAKLSSYKDIKDGYLLIKDGNTAYSLSDRKVSYEEFLKLTENNEKRYEYISGQVFLLASPGISHQLVHSKLYEKLVLWFRNKKCQVLSAPFDVKLINLSTNSKNVVQPDLLVACDLENTNEDDRYEGIPSLVIEIVSPNSRSNDMIKKLNVYLEGGVHEYWIIDPRDKIIIQYFFVSNQLNKMEIYKETDTITSQYFNGLTISLKEVFE